ncbi:MAG: NADH-quinone oxidoreductase subunit N, partial [Myxococcota bacterium]
MLQDLFHTLPLGIPALMGCFVLLTDAFAQTPEGESTDSRYLGYVSAVGFFAVIACVYLLWDAEWAGFSTATFGQMMVLGRFELATCALLALIGGCVSLMCVEHAYEHGFDHGELYALINFAVFGMMVLVCATNAVTLFVGLEIMSIAIYCLAAIKRTSGFAAEAALKYFILGAFASGFLLMGLAYVYGETGSFEYGAILASLYRAGEPSTYTAIALFMIVAAFGFKIALVPFHMWTPDVYEGSPPPIAGLMATGVKTAAVISMARIFVMVFPSGVLGWLGTDLFDALAILAVVTMTVANLTALHQRNIKRMLGYSSVAHAGYLLIGILAAHVGAGPGSEGWGAGLGAILFYLFVYALANLAVFAVIGAISRDGDDDITLDKLAGLATSHPVAALVLAIGMLSLA